MGAGYGTFCPVAKAMEVLDERWTLLIVLEMLNGTSRFGEIQKGVARMSPALLSTRLTRLVKAGVVTKTGTGSQVRYGLTDAGKELAPIIDALAEWGIRWAGDLNEDDVDPKLLVWELRRNAITGALPEGRTLVHFRFPESPVNRSWWMTLDQRGADVCDYDKGETVDLTVTADRRGLIAWWLGSQSWAATLRAEQVVLDGPSHLRRDFPNWFALSSVCEVPRVSEGASGRC